MTRKSLSLIRYVFRTARDCPNAYSHTQTFKILRKCPVVHVFADMSIKVSQILAKSEFFAAVVKGGTDAKHIARMLINVEQHFKTPNAPLKQWRKMRVESMEYMSRLAQALNNVGPTNAQTAN